MYEGFSLVGLPQPLIGWAVRPTDVFFFLLDRRIGDSSPRETQVLFGPAWSHWLCMAGTWDLHLRPVLAPVLPEVSLIPHTVRFSEYSAVKKSASLCSAQLFCDVLGHRLLFAPVIPTNVDLNRCPVFCW